MQLNSYIDHTLLRPTATPDQIQRLCAEAKQHQFHAVCVNGCYVALASQLLAGSGVLVAAVVGFPLGAMSQAAKLYEAQQCLQDGADEIDLVLNLGWLKAQQDERVVAELGVIKQTTGPKLLKVILETCYLTDAEKQRACELAVAAQADFVKTSTGFGPGGASFADVALLKQTVGNRAQVKASGGIKQAADALKLIELGATRLGTSAGVQLMADRQV
ncbi:MAG: deoxyribose-phosphate aldolase [Elainella sp.]